MMMQNILMVCVGNICRSPMAEGLLRHYSDQNDWGLTVHSAGLSAVVGSGPSPQSLAIMTREGIDISQHRARQITMALVCEADLILVMEAWHQKELGCIFPSVYGKVHRLGKWDDFDILDPYRQSDEVFEKSYQLIEQGLLSWQKKIWGVHV